MGLHFLTLYMAAGAESPWLCLTGLTPLHCASSLAWGLHSNGKGDWAIEASTRQGSYTETGLHPGTAPSLPVTHSSSSVPACTQTCGPALALRLPPLRSAGVLLATCAPVGLTLL